MFKRTLIYFILLDYTKRMTCPVGNTFVEKRRIVYLSCIVYLQSETMIRALYRARMVRAYVDRGP